MPGHTELTYSIILCKNIVGPHPNVHKAQTHHFVTANMGPTAPTFMDYNVGPRNYSMDPPQELLYGSHLQEL